MWKDEIIEEVRKTRDEYAAKFDYDLDAIYKDIKLQEKKSKRKLVSLRPKPVEIVSVEKSF